MNIDMTDHLTTSERNLLTCMQHNPDSEVVAVGIMETRAALRFADAGIAEIVAESQSSVDRWGAGSIRIRLTPRN
jgi:hypothetical protein